MPGEPGRMGRKKADPAGRPRVERVCIAERRRDVGERDQSHSAMSAMPSELTISLISVSQTSLPSPVEQSPCESL